MWRLLRLALIGFAAMVTLAACAAETMQPTATDAPAATPRPTATPQPAALPEGEEGPALTDADRAYLGWVGEVQGRLQETAQDLIEGWQQSEAAGAGEVSAEAVEGMEDLAATLQSLVDESEARAEVPPGVSEVHEALLEEMRQWETAAPLLVESAKALRDGDAEASQEQAEAADEAIQAAVEARRALLEATQRVLARLEEEGGD